METAELGIPVSCGILKYQGKRGFVIIFRIIIRGLGLLLQFPQKTLVYLTQIYNAKLRLTYFPTYFFFNIYYRMCKKQQR